MQNASKRASKQSSDRFAGDDLESIILGYGIAECHAGTAIRAWRAAIEAGQSDPEHYARVALLLAVVADMAAQLHDAFLLVSEGMAPHESLRRH